MRSDIANMRVARMARAPVLIVGDIDRGGVFASLVGTMALLPPGDRRRVAGFLINKFRGDVSLLAPALADLRRRTERRVLGVVPFLSSLKLPEEDSVALDAPISTSAGAIHIAVVRVPHIANFTDFAPLEAEAGVRAPGDPARVQGHHCRSQIPPNPGIRVRASRARGPRTTDPRHLRWLPDAGPLRARSPRHRERR